MSSVPSPIYKRVASHKLDVLPASKFHHRGNGHGLKICEGPGRDRGRERVGDIIGTNVPRIKEGKDGAQSKDVIKLVKYHLVGWLGSVCGSWPRNELVE